MLSRKITNIIRFVMDECVPPILRDNKYLMYPLFYIWFKGKFVKKNMEFKESFHSLSEQEFSEYYKNHNSYAENRPTDLSLKSIKYIIDNLDIIDT